MAKALDVAKFLVQLAECEQEPELLSHLRLQKLLYYVQAWHLAIQKKPLFPEKIEAWANGPVVSSVYHQFKRFGSNPILGEEVRCPQSISREEKDFISQVWEAYKGYSATSLREMTHREDPWKAARKGLRPGDRSNKVISHASMIKYFSKPAK